MSGMEQRFGGSSFLQGALDRFWSPELLDFIRQWKIDLDQVESLKRMSAMIEHLFDEAEVKQFSSNVVKLWLHHLIQLLYDAEDILDEFANELQRLKLESAHQTQQSGRESMVKDINETLEGIDQHPKVYNIAKELQGIKRFGSKVKDIHEKLKSVVQEDVALGLKSSMGFGSSRPKVFSERPPTSSLVNSSNVFGRDEDKWKIVKWLLSDKIASPSNINVNNLSVLPIVGMGGVGKTTLSQLVYNDQRVEKHFQLKAWVCVTEDFDVVRLTKEILESATGSFPSSNSLDLLQLKLKEALSNKRFLLVLDDMWNEDYESWDVLSTTFAFGKPGSKILVTTRNKGVSSIVRTVENDHDLKGLSDDACFAMVKRHAFVDGNSCDANQKLELFGQEIVNKCKGLPLAVKTLAGLLRDKRENSEWKDILENEIWDLKETKILPSLILSYHHLPPLLKRCFQYCALFPKDYVFNKIESVMLWIAEGIVQPKSKVKKRVEDIGVGYFDELFMRSFFELSNLKPSNWWTYSFVMPKSYFTYDTQFNDLSIEFSIRSFFESSSNTGSGFVMHGLIHDLAEYVSDGIYWRREYDKPSKVLTTTTRHLSFLTKNFNVEVSESEAMNKSLRTIVDVDLPYGRDVQVLTTMKLQFLRVLRLRKCCNHELPESIGKLRHLRLLDLLGSNFVRLPDSITTLYNLQTMVLIGCWSLKELPKGMGNLVNLRHLFLPIWSIDDDSYNIPLGVGNLTNLQTLSTFVAGSKNSSEYLRSFSQQLRGSLDITNLENIGNNVIEAMAVSLKNSPHLLGLWLRWSHYETKDYFPDLGRYEKAEEDVLDHLQPPTNLEAIWIQNYGGTRFPNWMEHPSYSNLKTVSLLFCRKCKFLPYLRQLPFLKHLVIYGCSAIKIMGSELYEDMSSAVNKQFQSLETLRIKWMDEWEKWTEVVEKDESVGQFPCLRVLIIKSSPKLRMFSHHFPSLVELKIKDCDNLSELPRILPSLQQLSISECPKLVVIPSLPSIERLYLSKCDEITTLSTSNHPSSVAAAATTTTTTMVATLAPQIHDSLPCLRELKIKCCPNLRELPCILPSLESLSLEDCKELCFPPMLPSIKELTLQRCKGKALLNNKTVLHLSSLSSLTIDDVSDLKSLPSGFMQHLTSLQELNIYWCKELTVLWLNEIGFDLLASSLRRLCIVDCDNLGKLPQGVCNFNCLEELIIIRTRGLTTLPEKLQNLMSLQKLEIRSCPALLSFPETGLPIGLQHFHIRDCKNLEALPMELHTLTSLQTLEIMSCPALVSFPETRLPTTLRELSIQYCGKLNSLHQGPNKLTNLELLRSLGVHNLASLELLILGGYPALVSFPKGLLPTNLKQFYIKDCPILESLHEGLSDVTTLEKLSIQNCPMVTQRRHEKKGDIEWSKIAQIPEVIIDGELQ
ncbi:putative disease resistance RPP13-like protein 1 [Macadamia integrifolia]|uniref:putative disease resistance RPP13-like protein 1 n=1 Tax=Macadamia integrifolia TaxID=60698 RepID=UPI001C4F37AF|nr:putative disease resistance RPP13-like protein 1 [Macadamia integrifolia]XP_042484174.1 putative disease resistance RPP13-like protein 1 [Macadamia integrifolia]XP_042484175.1 putative disease resistance RPP13-like protein 1 [Macadamia integrifolia]XP_042484176.1 putative disease resistance RPP13-like protein 1 [Macadamia integrifolia]XP_042484177.1 putative disease resistance RPP13-like protein 1 [Macadamia integrifolia]XP_042484178.1 putative disease resistance RPP13-like protein 1 [Macad